MAHPGPIMLDLKGTHIEPEEKEMLQHPACGGVILFARNIEDAEQTWALIQSIRSVNDALLIAVDQEGGRVQRLREGFTALPPLRALEQQENEPQPRLELIRAHATIMALETQMTGFDISFAPVLDLATETSRVIGDRAFHEEPEQVLEYAKCYVAALNATGMAATGKHFPGHGTVDADSHHELPIDDRSLTAITERDLIPFAGLAGSLQGIMPGHIIFPQVDALPAGFSHVWIEQILRQQLKFQGAVFTDDLSMKGAEVVGDFQARVNAAIEAGCDMMLVCNHPEQAGYMLEHLSGYRNTHSQARIEKMFSVSARQGTRQDFRMDARWQTAQSILNRYSFS